MANPSSGALTRRRFLGASFLFAATSPGILRAQLDGLEWRFLTAGEARTLGFVADIIVPPDDDPGGAWAGVVQFIDRKLVGYYRNFQPLYRLGLAAFDTSSVETFGRALSDIAVHERTALFARLEQAQLPANLWTGVSQGEFCNRVIDHTLQGFLGAPRHGGNRDAVSWRMLGLPYPPLRSRRPESPSPSSEGRAR